MEIEERVEWEKLPTAELVEELKCTGLDLPPALVEEIVRRGAEAVPLLGRLVADARLWDEEGDEGWAPRFALHLLGGIGDPAAAPFIVRALRLAPEPDEIVENTPTVIGHLGATAIPEFARFILDEKADGLMRGVACDGLASLALLHPVSRGPIVSFLRRFVEEAAQHNEESVTGAVLALDELRDRESLPAIVKAFHSGRVDEDYIGIDDVRRDMEKPETISAKWEFTGDPLEYLSPRNLECMARELRDG